MASALPSAISCRLEDHKGSVLALAFNRLLFSFLSLLCFDLSLPSTSLSSDDGNYCMSGGQDQTIKLWNPSKGSLIKTFAGAHGYEVLDIAMHASLCPVASSPVFLIYACNALSAFFSSAVRTTIRSSFHAEEIVRCFCGTCKEERW